MLTERLTKHAVSRASLESLRFVVLSAAVSLLVKYYRSPAAAGAEAVIDLFGFSAGARRLPNSALRASPKIVRFALSELKNCRRPKDPKGTAAGCLKQRPAAGRFGAPPQTRAGGLGKRKRGGGCKRQTPPRSPSRTSKFSP